MSRFRISLELLLYNQRPIEIEMMVILMQQMERPGYSLFGLFAICRNHL